jgi:hypothetical protein
MNPQLANNPKATQEVIKKSLSITITYMEQVKGL